MSADAPRIHLAFRFHVNFYHSYRGDSLDERGIGKDIRIIRGILDDLDALEAEGIALRCAWDIENYYTLELYLPRHAPDILERIRTRVGRGLDEVELMAWNNGLMTAHTREEFREAISRAVTNPQGSGLADLFPSWAPIVRPQECMFTSAHIEAYRELGIEALSVYYSAIPFNGFGSFVPLLAPERRFNPMGLVDPTTGARMRLLPACNHADLVEAWLSLAHWLKRMRRQQLALPQAQDFLLVVDMDADDKFWGGYLPRSLAGLLPSACGLRSLATSVAGFPWLSFTRPWDYLSSHEDLGQVSLGQDLADGAWDGYSSWAEKAENAALWTELARARRVAEIAQRVRAEAGEAPGPGAGLALDEILKALSTTHFGMASPVMNSGRLEDGFRHVRAGLGAAEAELAAARASRREGSGAWRFDPEIEGLEEGQGSLTSLQGPATAGLSGIELVEDGCRRKERRALLNPQGSAEASLRPMAKGGDLAMDGDGLRVGGLGLRILAKGGLDLREGETRLLRQALGRPWIEFAGRRRWGRQTAPARLREVLPDRVAEIRLEGVIDLPGEPEATWIEVFTMVAGLERVYVDTWISYPLTECWRYDRAKASRLDRAWDGRWTGLAPLEVCPVLDAREDAPARVWKHGYFDRVSSYDLEYHRFGPNREQDSLDNHVTDAWVALAAGGRGILLAQSASASTVFAFCPMRTRLRSGRQTVDLNPFGTYSGRQWRYPAATSGLGRMAAILGADNLDPYAPSWSGTELSFSLLLAPYEGDRPPEGLQRDALIFATPPEHA